MEIFTCLGSRFIGGSLLLFNIFSFIDKFLNWLFNFRQFFNENFEIYATFLNIFTMFDRFYSTSNMGMSIIGYLAWEISNLLNAR